MSTEDSSPNYNSFNSSYKQNPNSMQNFQSPRNIGGENNFNRAVKTEDKAKMGFLRKTQPNVE